MGKSYILNIGVPIRFTSYLPRRYKRIRICMASATVCWPLNLNALLIFIRRTAGIQGIRKCEIRRLQILALHIPTHNILPHPLTLPKRHCLTNPIDKHIRLGRPLLPQNPLLTKHLHTPLPRPSCKIQQLNTEFRPMLHRRAIQRALMLPKLNSDFPAWVTTLEQVCNLVFRAPCESPRRSIH